MALRARPPGEAPPVSGSRAEAGAVAHSVTHAANTDIPVVRPVAPTRPRHARLKSRLPPLRPTGLAVGLARPACRATGRSGPDSPHAMFSRLRKLAKGIRAGEFPGSPAPTATRWPRIRRLDPAGTYNARRRKDLRPLESRQAKRRLPNASTTLAHRRARQALARLPERHEDL